MKHFAVIVTAALLSIGVAGAQPPPMPPPPGSAAPQSIGLSPEQLKRVEALHRQFGARTRALEQTLSERKRSLEALYKQFDFDKGQAKQTNKEINSIQRDLLNEHLNLQIELRKILTQDQFDRLREGMERRRPGPRSDYRRR